MWAAVQSDKSAQDSSRDEVSWPVAQSSQQAAAAAAVVEAAAGWPAVRRIMDSAGGRPAERANPGRPAPSPALMERTKHNSPSPRTSACRRLRSAQLREAPLNTATERLNSRVPGSAAVWSPIVGLTAAVDSRRRLAVSTRRHENLPRPRRAGSSAANDCDEGWRPNPQVSVRRALSSPVPS